MTNIRVALTNLGKYNEGELVYVWLDLPADEDEIKAAFDEIGVVPNTEYEEYFITDYEAPFSIGEYASLTNLNKQADRWAELSEDEIEYARIICEEHTGDLDEAIGIVENGEYSVYHDCRNMGDVAHDMIHEHGLFGDTSAMGNLENYIDYDKLGRDLDIEGVFLQSDKDDLFIEVHG